MTWEQTIKFIQDKPEYQDLIRQAYLSEDLNLNIELYRKSAEYAEVKKQILNYSKGKVANIIDIGSGNGISAISFALDGYNVTAIEPDSSDLTGCGAINKMKRYYKLENIKIIQSFAENIPVNNKEYDLVFIRQSLHHANNLTNYVDECSRLLKKGGIFFSIRDHIINVKKDLAEFLESHPLHKFYGGENAYTLTEYKKAIRQAGLNIIKELLHFDSIINYSPLTKEEVKNKLLNIEKKKIEEISKKYGNFINTEIMIYVYKRYRNLKYGNPFRNNKPGSLVSFIAQKQ